MLNCLIYRGIEEFSWLIPHSFSVAKHFTYKVFMSPPPGDEQSCACRHFPRIEFILVMKQNTFRMVLAFCVISIIMKSQTIISLTIFGGYIWPREFSCVHNFQLWFQSNRLSCPFPQNNFDSKEFQKFAPPSTSWFYVFCLYTQLMWHLHCAWYTVHLTNQTL